MADYGASGLLPGWMFDERFGQDWPQMQTAPQGFNGGYLDYRWGPENDGGKAFNQLDISQRYNGMTGIDPRAMGESVLTANDPNMPPPPYQAPQQPMGPLPPAPDWLNGPPTRVAGGSAMGYAPEQPRQQQPLANFPVQAPQQQSGWDRFGQGINNNAMTLVGLGAGIAGGRGWGEGISRGLQGAMLGQKSDREQRLTQQSQQATAQALLAKGVPPAVVNAAIQNPKMLESVLKQVFPELKGEKIGDVGFTFNPSTGQWMPAASAPRYDKLGPGEILQETRPSVGGRGGTSGPVASGGPEKAPAGYRWRDPNDQSKGMDPIPGGPATHLPAETAGRLALMQAAKPDLEMAKEYFLSDKFKAGPIDAAVTAGAQAMEAGDTGRARSAVRRSIEAALRTATGAAAPESEVKRYEKYYLPSVYDVAETRRQKLEALDRFNEHAERNVGQGRMPPPESFLKTKAKPDPFGFRK